MGLRVCPNFGGEDNGDGSLCGRRRNKPVPLLHHLPDEPGECSEYSAVSELTQVLVLLTKPQPGRKALWGKEHILQKYL